MVVDLPRRWRWIVSGASAAVLALAGLFVVLARSAVPESGAPGAVRRVLPAALAQDPSPGIEAPPALPPTAREDDGEIEVCGAGWVRVGALGREGDAALPDAASTGSAAGSAATEQLLLDLQAGDDRMRASALLLEAGRAEPADGSAREALARLAYDSTDPWVYGRALRSCVADVAPDSACSMLNPRRWAQLDPGNAAPWVFMLGAAHARGDLSLQEEALHQIASAQVDAPGSAVAAAEILSGGGADDASRVAAYQLAGAALRSQASEQRLDEAVLRDACGPRVLQDANRRQDCTAVAEMLVSRSFDPSVRAVGATIGHALGWDAARLGQLDEASAQAAAASVGPSTQDLSCRGLRRWSERVVASAGMGLPAGTARRDESRVARSGGPSLRASRP